MHTLLKIDIYMFFLKVNHVYGETEKIRRPQDVVAGRLSFLKELVDASETSRRIQIGVRISLFHLNEKYFVKYVYGEIKKLSRLQDVVAGRLSVA